MRVWKDPAYTVGSQDPDTEYRVHNGKPCLSKGQPVFPCYVHEAHFSISDTVTGAVFHPMGTVVATCSGQRPQTQDDEDYDSTNSGNWGENSLKVWSMPFLAEDESVPDPSIET